MAYIVCQTSKCQQTYPVEQFNAESKNIKCEKCDGVLIDKNGRANFSQHSRVIPVIEISEMNKNNERKLKEKRNELAALESEISEMEELGC